MSWNVESFPHNYKFADMKPIIKYRGGKSKEIQYLAPHIPQFEGRYIEPFFGGGAMYFYLEPNNAIINDINVRLMNFYKAVQNDYEILHEELRQLESTYTQNRKNFEELKKQHPGDRVPDENEFLYYRLRDMYNGLITPTYSEAALYFYINKTAYSGMIRFNAKGEYNVPYGRYKNFNTSIITEAHQHLLQDTEIYTGDYREIFDMVHPNDFVFLDPPYDCVFSDYGNEEYRDGFNEENHRQLSEDFFNLGCPALMVIGATPLTMELYDGHIIAEYEKNYAINIRNRFQAAARHIIITNNF